MECVASTPHTTSEHGVSSITTADVHTLAASGRLNWIPCRFKRTRPFRQNTKPGFCACAITFQMQSTCTCFNGTQESGGITPLIRNSAPDGGERSLTLQPLYTWTKCIHLVPTEQKLAWAWNQSWHWREKLVPLPWSEPRFRDNPAHSLVTIPIRISRLPYSIMQLTRFPMPFLHLNLKEINLWDFSFVYGIKITIFLDVVDRD